MPGFYEEILKSEGLTPGTPEARRRVAELVQFEKTEPEKAAEQKQEYMSRLRTSLAKGETGLSLPTEEIAAEMGEQGVPMYEPPKTTVQSLSPYAKTLGFETTPEGEPYIPAMTRETEKQFFAGVPAAQEVAQAGMGALGMPGMPSLRPLEGALEARAAARPGQLEELQAPYEQQRAALEQRAGIAEQAAAAEAQQKEFNRLKWETEMGEQRDREAKRQQYIQGEIDSLGQEMDAIKTAGVDPMNWYKHPDGSNNYGKSIAASIAVMLGFIGGRKTGTNQALQIINKAIDRDIDAQKTNLQNRRAGIGLQMNLLGRMMSKFDSERQQDSATRLIMLETAKMKLDEVAAPWKGPMQQAAYAGLMADLDAQQAQEKVKFEQASHDQAIDKEAKLFTVKSQRAAAQQKAVAARAAAQAKAAPPPMPPGMEILDPARRMPSEKTMDKAVEMVGAYDDVSTKLRNLLAWREQYGAELPGGALVKGNSMLSRTKAAMRHLDKAGANLSDNEIELMGLNFEMGDLGWIRERIETVLGSVTQKTGSQLKPMNIRLAGQPTAGARRRQ